MIEIKTFATWENAISIFGSFSSPIILLAKIINSNNRPFIINEVCVSIKTNYLLYKSSKDVLQTKIGIRASNTQNNEIEFDLRNLLNKYGENKKFTIKAIVNNIVYESEVVSLSIFNV